MKYLTLTIKHVEDLNVIQQKLAEFRPILPSEQIFLSEFLMQLPLANECLPERMLFDKTLAVILLETSQITDEETLFIKKLTEVWPTAETLDELIAIFKK